MLLNWKSADMEKDWPRLETLYCVPSANSNPKGVAHVTQDSIANQHLWLGPPIEVEVCSSLCHVSLFCVLTFGSRLKDWSDVF